MKLTVRVTPNARTSEILSWQNSVLSVRLHAPPQEGKGNEELVRLLATTFHLPKSSINLLHGAQGRTKVVELPISATDLQRFASA